MRADNPLLEQFVAQECDEYVLRLIRRALADGDEDAAVEYRYLEFNRFELALDFKAGGAHLADLLENDATETLELGELKARLLAHSETLSGG